MLRTLFTVFLGTFGAFLAGQPPWSVASYPDETGFLRRMSPVVSRWAERPFGTRTLATSRCPDTDRPVRTYALEGETIYSPYTGRAYVQGPTGYFGPKARDAAGRIVAFGGDPLKYDLPPATAALLLDPTHELARTYLSIPASLRQQYHFACKNWARFYPLLAETMGPAWRSDFREAVAEYYEERRPSDGKQEYIIELSRPHSLIGEPGTLLGGNSIDGGTENHKTMWRTSALVYAQHFPDSARISGYTPAETKRIVGTMIADYLRGLLRTGNGEYDSSIYYPHSIEGFLNLYDFSTDPQLRSLAKFALDYYFATYALKTVDGFPAGAQKRGYLPGAEPGEMEDLLWGFFGETSRPVHPRRTSLHQATTTYRPNRLITDLYRGRVAYPFSARMSRPFYHMDRANAFQESFYRSENFGLGNVLPTIVDNPNQQMIWSLVVKGERGPLGFTGGQQFARSFTGHSPYTQTLHDRGTLLLLTADSDPTAAPATDFTVATNRLNPWHLPDTAQVADFELANRRKYATPALRPVRLPTRVDSAFLADLFAEKTYAAASWLWWPRGLAAVREAEYWLVNTPEVWVVVRPVGEGELLVSLDQLPGVPIPGGKAGKQLRNYDLLVVAGKHSGFVVEAVEKDRFPTREALHVALTQETRLDRSRLDAGILTYRSLYGADLQLHYEPRALRPRISVDGEVLDYENWTPDGRVYASDLLRVGGGELKLSNGREAYQVTFGQKDEIPHYKIVKPE